MENKEKLIEFAINKENMEEIPAIKVFNVKIPLKWIIREILPELKDAFYWYLEGEDNSWRIKRNWESYKKTLEEKYGKK